MTGPEWELANWILHCVPGKSNKPSIRHKLTSRLEEFCFFFFNFELIEEWLLAEEASSPTCSRQMLADASRSRRRPLLPYGPSGNQKTSPTAVHQPRTWVVRKALHQKWSTKKGRSKIYSWPHKERPAQRTTLAPLRSKYRIWDKKYRWQKY